jgi:general nucleoside transport system ATP-binding protein
LTEAPSTNVANVHSTATAPVAVELVGITKRFPGVLANDHVSFAVRHGEVHCLLGENGAGKSTLMSILSGMQSPDSGQIRIDGNPVSIDSPRRALDLGIGTVYQHSALVPALTVLENLMLGESRTITLQVDAARKRLQELAGMLGVDIDPNAQLRNLALGQQQQVEIIKALWRGSRVLILDEPTSMLTPQGVAELQKVLVRLQSHGLAIIFITHKLHEALAIGDRISILKQGRAIATLDEATLTSHSNEELQALIVDTMFGDEARVVSGVAELQGDLEGRGGQRKVSGQVVLELVGVSAGSEDGGGIHDISFAVRRGEILGIAGVDGNGQHELAEVIAGQRQATAGDIKLEGASINGLSVSARQRLGVRYITDDRLGEGIVSSLSVALNLVLKRIGQEPFWRRGVIQQQVLDGVARDLVDEFEVRTPGIHTRAGTLSGGNIQKVILARELSFDPRVVVYNKPTQGLDVRTTATVRQRILQQAEEGITAIVISTELDELLTLSDTIAVLYRGRLQGMVTNSPEAGERVGEMMIGGRAE